MKNLKSIWWISLVIKLIISALVPLSSDEAYYWVWSRFPDLSYYDHPGMVAWLFRLGEPFLSFGNAVRWPAILLGHCTLIIWFYILKDYLNIEKIRWYFYLVLFSPLLGFGSIVITPDLPVIFFWSLAIYFFIQILQGPLLRNYILLGLSLGLGFCSKYHIVLFVPAMLLYLLIEKQWKRVNYRGICVCIFFGIVGSLPVLIWNFTHDFASFRFQLSHGLGRNDYDIYWTWSYLLAQLLLLFPITFYLGIRCKPRAELRCLIYFAWFPLLFFLLTSFKGVVEINWPIIAYPSFFALVVIGASSIKPIKFVNLFWLLIVCLVIVQAKFAFIKNGPSKVNELTRFKPILSVRAKYEPLFCETYQMCSWIWYESKKPIYKIWGMSRIDYFDNFDNGFPDHLPKNFNLAMHLGDPLPSWFKDSHFTVRVLEQLENELVIVRVSEP